MSTRDLLTPRQRQGLADVLQTCFASELLAPSKRLWLMSAWISDIEVLDNTGGAFAALCPDWAFGKIRLSAIFARIAQLGGSVFIAMNETPHNDAFCLRLKELKDEFGNRIDWCRVTKLHQKCLCGDDFAIRGSMNFTYYGLNVNEEQMTVTTSLHDVALLRIELDHRWKDAIDGATQ
jgi:phosphatidylserine/phosphatidylglycerophosphate/cardiolipin synthase-like enzyme